MRRMLGVLMAILAIAAGLFAGVVPASATPHVFEDGVSCPEYETTPNKETLTGEQMSVTVTAPAGTVIAGYCVKAVFEDQDLGVHEETGLSATTIVITFPSAPPRGIAHYTIDYEPTEPVTPIEEPIKVHPPAPDGIEYCGAASGGVRDGMPCPIFIVVQPEVPTVCKGVPMFPASTVQVSYAGDSENVYGYPQAGHLFVQDIATPGKDHIVWPISTLKETCPPEETVIVSPPVDQAPPAVDAPPATDVLPVANAVPAVETVAEAPVATAQPEVSQIAAPLADVGSVGVKTAASTEPPANTGLHPLLVLAGVAGVVLVLAGAAAMLVARRRLGQTA